MVGLSTFFKGEGSSDSSLYLCNLAHPLWGWQFYISAWHRGQGREVLLGPAEAWNTPNTGTSKKGRKKTLGKHFATGEHISAKMWQRGLNTYIVAEAS